jgi:23S rRNA (cytosine1962-C5)-methyltransferase
MRTLPDIVVPTALKEQLTAGHPWVYRTHVPPDLYFPAGSWVRVRCGAWSGYGLWDAESPIAVRIFSTRQRPDPEWVEARVASAWQLREPLRRAGHTAYRWLFGEGDGLPGITVDRYGDAAVVLVYLNGADTLVEWVIEAMQRVAPLQNVVVRGRRNDDDEATLHATARSSPTIVSEHGLRFQVELATGQKSGLFLDHRENRKTIETWSAGRDVLNCFAYTGGFSLYALRGGASSVVSTDIGKGLADATNANIALNRLLDSNRHQFVTADCFELLNDYAAQGRTFDLVILDPPSFAKRREQRYAALRAYTRLNTLALQCVAPNGLLATASCTSQVGPEAFREILGTAATAAQRRVQIIHEAGQPLDHPVPAHFLEGRYLKFLLAHVGPLV